MVNIIAKILYSLLISSALSTLLLTSEKPGAWLEAYPVPLWRVAAHSLIFRRKAWLAPGGGQLGPLLLAASAQASSYGTPRVAWPLAR